MTDLINRQAAIDAINALHEKPNAWLDSAVDAVMALPSAQPERWIPCNERLPEAADVLCCDVRGEMCIAYPYADKESNTGYSAESDSVYMIDCIAWMPLPEPYQEGKNE